MHPAQDATITLLVQPISKGHCLTFARAQGLQHHEQPQTSRNEHASEHKLVYPDSTFFLKQHLPVLHTVCHFILSACVALINKIQQSVPGQKAAAMQ